VLIVEENTVLLIKQNSGTKGLCCIFYMQRPYGVTIHSNCQYNQHFKRAANFQNWVGCFCGSTCRMQHLHSWYNYHSSKDNTLFWCFSATNFAVQTTTNISSVLHDNWSLCFM